MTSYPRVLNITALNVKCLTFCGRLKMKFTLASILFVAFLTAIKPAMGKGEATTSIECLGPGMKGKKTELKCKISGTIKTGIWWIRPDTVVVSECERLYRSCKSYDHYQSVVHTSSDNTLIIWKFDPESDVGQWTCKDGEYGKPAPPCQKTSTNKFRFRISPMHTYPRLRIYCSEQIRCVVTGRLDRGIWIIRPDGTVVVKCKPFTAWYPSCQAIGKYDGWLSNHHLTKAVIVRINSFDPQVDIGQWTCRDGPYRISASTCMQTAAR
ncbi:uncharacterized protein LOC121386217 isoform X2 [Gigantopelta aegis]|uniref:uncharacterized protein LOC121386217 isoform X2 n=1 Tax=Gigantopelta aegis TaxID=1735272 RepID=UPI001B88D641|nr:uncharacterized protein LOC121386217 isoform X2 [Gigantopelta aegis]